MADFDRNLYLVTLYRKQTWDFFLEIFALLESDTKAFEACLAMGSEQREFYKMDLSNPNWESAYERYCQLQQILCRYLGIDWTRQRSEALGGCAKYLLALSDLAHDWDYEA